MAAFHNEPRNTRRIVELLAELLYEGYQAWLERKERDANDSSSHAEEHGNNGNKAFRDKTKTANP